MRCDKDHNAAGEGIAGGILGPAWCYHSALAGPLNDKSVTETIQA
jgi:hypothetical protein